MIYYIDLGSMRGGGEGGFEEGQNDETTFFQCWCLMKFYLFLNLLLVFSLALRVF